MYEISRFNSFGKCPVGFIILDTVEVMTTHGTFYLPSDSVLLTDEFEFCKIRTKIWLRTHENGRAFIWDIKKAAKKLYLTDDYRPFVYKFVAEEEWWKTLLWVKESDL